MGNTAAEGAGMTRRTLLSTLWFWPVARGHPFGAGAWKQVAISMSLAGRHVCCFQNGYLSVRDADRQTVTIVDTGGNVVGSFRFSVPEAVVAGVFHLAVSAARTLAAAVEAMAADGRYASLLIFSDLQGAIKRVVRTNPFAPVRPLFLPDGRLVCVGREIDEQLNEVEGYHVLRFYSSEGVFLSKAAPIELLRPTRRDPEPMEWDLVAGDGRIGLLDRNNLRYVEFDDRGNLVRPLAALGIDRPAGAMGMALLASGRRLIAIEHRNVADLKDRYKLYVLRSGPGGMKQRKVTGIAPPEGCFGFSVLGVHQGNVVLLTTPGDAMVFVPESAFLAAET
jgi:hypothetical protein